MMPADKALDEWGARIWRSQVKRSRRMSSFGVCSVENFGYGVLTVFLVVLFIGQPIVEWYGRLLRA